MPETLKAKQNQTFSSTFIAMITVQFFFFLSQRQRANNFKKEETICFRKTMFQKETIVLSVGGLICLKIEYHQWFQIRNIQCCHVVPNSHQRLTRDSFKTENCSSLSILLRKISKSFTHFCLIMLTEIRLLKKRSLLQCK